MHNVHILGYFDNGFGWKIHNGIQGRLLHAWMYMYECAAAAVVSMSGASLLECMHAHVCISRPINFYLEKMFHLRQIE